MTLEFPRTRTLLMGGASVATVVLALSVTLNTKFHIGLVPPIPASIGENDASALNDVGIGRTSTSPETPAANIPAQPSQRSAVKPENRAREREPAGLADAESTGSQQSWNQTFYFSPPAPLASESAPAEQPAPGYVDQGRDRFKEIDENDVKAVVEDPVSTFSIDVDTASYSFVRSSLMNGFLPQKAAVRVEEMINYFPYDYSRPESPGTPFSTDVTVMPTPWNANTKLMRIAVQGYDVAPVEKPRTNIVFLIDTSGSMNAPDKLPLLRNSFRMLVDRLD
ncbi:MAG: von Willebrand factor type A domain-containing protein, partial [Pseudomonadota bacterium]